MQKNTQEGIPTTAAPLMEHVGKLITDVTPVQLQLVEGADGKGKVIVRGEFGRAGAATENKRVYPKKIWEREFLRLDSPLSNRQVFGELDHPTDGRTSLNRVSHVLTGLSLNDEGIVQGEAEILDTERGKNLMALLKAGCKVGVSSRGYGSTKPNDQGMDEVQEDYRLVTFDFVADPADVKALPGVFYEENLHMASEDLQVKLDEERGKLRKEFSEQLVTALANLKVEAHEQAQAELLKDPELAGAKDVVDQIKVLLRPYLVTEEAEAVVKAKDEEIAGLKTTIAEQFVEIEKLKTEVESLSNAAREVGYKFYLEQQLANDPDSDVIRQAIGEVNQYAKVEDLQGKIEAIRVELNKKREEQDQLEARIRDEASKVTAAAQAETKQAKAEAAKMREALEKALTSEKELALKYYTERKLVNHPQAAKVRSLIESMAPRSKEEVDKMIASVGRKPARDPDSLEETRSRVRAMTRGGITPSTKDEEGTSPAVLREETDFAGLGVPLNELKRLSGIDRDE